MPMYRDYDKMTYRQQVYAVMTNRYSRFDCVKVCDTPSLFVQLGMTQLPILYTPQHLRDAVLPYKPDSNRHLHCLSLETIKRLPELIADPVMIFKSPTHTNNLIIVTDELDHEGRPIITAIQPNVENTFYGGRQTESNLIKSVFGRNSFRSFLQRAIDQDCMIYCNNEKSQQLFSVLTVTMPQGLNNNVSFDFIIHQSTTKVNTEGEKMMFDYHRNYINATPFPDTIGFRGVQNYRIAAQLNGIVLGVTNNGNCAVWTGGYHANGELREVSGGHYFTGAEFGSDPEELYNAALSKFTDMAITGKVLKDAAYVTHDGKGIDYDECRRVYDFMEREFDMTDISERLCEQYGQMAAQRIERRHPAAFDAILKEYQRGKRDNDTWSYILDNSISTELPEHIIQDVQHNKTIFFDTETTGLNKDGTDEILSISIINENEEILLHTYVKPEHHTSWVEAQEINHISPEMVKDSPTLTQLKPLLKEIFTSADEIVAYNIAYDRKFIEPALDIHFGEKARCAMLEFADYYKEPNLKTGYGYRWKNLSFAMDNLGLTWRGQAHGSLADTYAAKDVWTALKNPSIEKKNTYEQSMRV